MTNPLIPLNLLCSKTCLRPLKNLDFQLSIHLEEMLQMPIFQLSRITVFQVTLTSPHSVSYLINIHRIQTGKFLSLSFNFLNQSSTQVETIENVICEILEPSYFQFPHVSFKI